MHIYTYIVLKTYINFFFIRKHHEEEKKCFWKKEFIASDLLLIKNLKQLYY